MLTTLRAVWEFLRSDSPVDLDRERADLALDLEETGWGVNAAPPPRHTP